MCTNLCDKRGELCGSMMYYYNFIIHICVDGCYVFLKVISAWRPNGRMSWLAWVCSKHWVIECWLFFMYHAIFDGCFLISEALPKMKPVQPHAFHTPPNHEQEKNQGIKKVWFENLVTWHQFPIKVTMVKWCTDATHLQAMPSLGQNNMETT